MSEIFGNVLRVGVKVDFDERQLKILGNNDYDFYVEKLIPLSLNDIVIGVIEDSCSIEDEDGRIVVIKFNIILWTKFIKMIDMNDFNNIFMETYVDQDNTLVATELVTRK